MPAIGSPASQHSEPGARTLAAIGLRDSSVEELLRRVPDIPACAVTLDEGDDGMVRHSVGTVGVLNGLAVGRDGNSVVAGLHECRLRQEGLEVEGYHLQRTSGNNGQPFGCAYRTR